MAVYTQVSAEALSAFLARYDVGDLISAKGIAEGVENSNYLVDTTTARFILTLYEKRVAAGDRTMPPVGQAPQFREVILPRQEGQSNREVVVARQGVLDCLGDVLARCVGLSLKEEVATVDVGAHVREAFSGDLFA